MTNLEKFIEVMNDTFDANFKPDNMLLKCSPCGALKHGKYACNHFNCLGCENWWGREYVKSGSGGSDTRTRITE